MLRSVLLLGATLGVATAFSPAAARLPAGLGRAPRRCAARAPAPRMGLSKVTDITKGEVHGEGGAYVAGYWVPYDKCEEHFNIKGGSGEKVAPEPCPRSRSRNSAAKEDGWVLVCSSWPQHSPTPSLPPLLPPSSFAIFVTLLPALPCFPTSRARAGAAAAQPASARRGELNPKP
jgi:hypothetical protein